MIRLLFDWIDFMMETSVEAAPYLIKKYPKTMLFILFELIVLFTLSIINSALF